MTEFNPGTGCKVFGSDGWCLAADTCVDACQYPHSSAALVELVGQVTTGRSTSERLRQAQRDLDLVRAELASARQELAALRGTEEGR